MNKFIFKSFLFIDPGTSGIASEYLNAYRFSADSSRIRVIGNYWANGSFVEKLFFKYSDLQAPNRINNQILRYFIRYIEYIYGLFWVNCICVISRPKKIFFALSLGRETIWEFFFFSLICRFLFRLNLTIICHDVVPFGNRHNLFWKIRFLYRKLLFKNCDSIIVHNNAGKMQLRRVFQVRNEKIYFLPFPVMDLGGYPDNCNSVSSQIYAADSVRNFLVIGSYREEKGFELLLDAWEIFKNSAPKNKSVLTIAGYGFPEVFSSRASQLSAVFIFNRFLSDLDYVNYMRRSDILILPYLRGTNSGPLSNAVSISLPVICTPISMFRRGGLIQSYSTCTKLSAASLASKIEWIAGLEQGDYNRLIRDIEILRTKRDFDFSNALNKILK